MREEKLKRSLESIGFKNINISEIDEIIKEIEEKLKKGWSKQKSCICWGGIFSFN